MFPSAVSFFWEPSWLTPDHGLGLSHCELELWMPLEQQVQLVSEAPVNGLHGSFDSA